MKIPRFPLEREAKKRLEQKLEKMRGIEKKKTIKRLQMDDRGFKYKKDGGTIPDKKNEYTIG